MSCKNCQDYVCIQQVPNSATTLKLGTITSNSTAVRIYAKKQNGAIAVQDATTDGSGTVTVDLTSPEADFYNPHGELYLFWVVLDSAESSQDRQDITIDGQDHKVLACEFHVSENDDTTTITAELL